MRWWRLWMLGCQRTTLEPWRPLLEERLLEAALLLLQALAAAGSAMGLLLRGAP